MARLFGINPAWGLPCVSPFVTKVAYALGAKKVPFELLRQNLATVGVDSPTGKLPYAILEDSTRLSDSSAILMRLAPDLHLNPRQGALSLALERMLDEHLYWHVAVEPRWLLDDDWERYRPFLFGMDPFPEELVESAQLVRERILGQWIGCGVGRLPVERRSERAVEDVRALESLFESSPYFFGSVPSNLDGAIAAMTAHAVFAPFDSPVRREVQKLKRLQLHLEHVLESCAALGT